jgi:hypothetical protein
MNKYVKFFENKEPCIIQTLNPHQHGREDCMEVDGKTRSAQILNYRLQNGKIPENVRLLLERKPQSGNRG